MTRHSRFALFFAVLFATWGCAEDDGGDDDTSAADDDATADDDDDATGDDDDATADDDDSAAPPNWSWGQANTDANADASLVGEVLDDWAGSNVRSPGDMNGDGIDDLVIGAFRNSELVYRGGKVYVVLGHERDWYRGEPLGPHPSVVGEIESMELSATHRVGDVNGDGLADLAIDPGYQNSAPQGGQYILLGRSKGWSSSVPVESVDVSLHNANANGSTDLSTRSYLGDFDGDGLDDWLLGGPVLFNGEAHVVSGADMTSGLSAPTDSSVWVYGGAAEGLYYVTIGDINGDGMADFYAYDPPEVHELMVLFGRTSGFPHDQEFQSSVDLRIQVDAGMAEQGLKNLGDVDGDGVADLGLTTSPHGLSIFLGRASWPATLGTSDADVTIAAGYPVVLAECPGDLDGDGVPDLLILGPNVADDPYAPNDAYLFFGRTSWPATLDLSDADVRIESVAPGAIEVYTWYDQHRGDLDGDGIEDLFLYNDDAHMGGVGDSGLVMVFAGRSSWPPLLSSDDADVTFAGTEVWQSMGQDHWSLVADINGDGRDDFVTSSALHPVATGQGETFIFFGQPR